MKLVLNCKANEEGGKIKQLLLQHQAGGNSIKFMLEQLQELKRLGASIPAPSLSSASSISLTLSPLKVIHLPCQKDALLSHFAKVAEALSPSTAFSLRQK